MVYTARVPSVHERHEMTLSYAFWNNMDIALR